MLERPGGLYGSRAPFSEVMGAQQNSDKCLLERQQLQLLLVMVVVPALEAQEEPVCSGWG